MNENTREPVTPRTPHPHRPTGWSGVRAHAPCLVTYVVPTMYHLQPLPGTPPEEALLALARRQVEFNRLPAWLVLDAERVLRIELDGSASPSRESLEPPALCAGMLRIGDRSDTLPEVRERLELIRAQLKERNRCNYVLGDLRKGGREATAPEIERLLGTQEGGVPLGLSRCKVCLEWRGECLDMTTLFQTLVVQVHCRCSNIHRCAACGHLLYERRLNANYYDEQTGKIWHVPGYCGLKHRCGEPRESEAGPPDAAEGAAHLDVRIIPAPHRTPNRSAPVSRTVPTPPTPATPSRGDGEAELIHVPTTEATRFILRALMHAPDELRRAGQEFYEWARQFQTLAEVWAALRRPEPMLWLLSVAAEWDELPADLVAHAGEVLREPPAAAGEGASREARARWLERQAGEADRLRAALGNPFLGYQPHPDRLLGEFYLDRGQGKLLYLLDPQGG